MMTGLYAVSKRSVERKREKYRIEKNQGTDQAEELGYV